MLSYLDGNKFGKRVIYEFAGMPKSGKSTTLDLVKQVLRGREIRVIDFHGGGRYAPIDKQFGGDLNLFLAAKIASRMAELRVLPCQFSEEAALLDRGPLDRIIFTIALRMVGEIDQSEEGAITKFLSSDRLTSAVDGTFVFRTSPRLSLDREAKVQVEPRRGRVMNETMLQALRDATEEALDRFASCFRNVRLIDTEVSDGEPGTTARDIASEILASLEVAE